MGKAYAIRSRRDWAEFYAAEEPPTNGFWRFVTSFDVNLAFCSQECADKFTDAHKLDYLMFLTNDSA